MIIRAIEDVPFSEACRSLWLEPNEVVIRDGGQAPDSSQK